MDKLYETGLLLDFYGQLLTDRQQEILDLYCNGDFSLAEIAENLNISRQGVYDNIKRGRAALNELESKLGLVRKFSEQKVKLEAVIKEIKEIDQSDMKQSDRLALKEAILDLGKLVKEI